MARSNLERTIATLGSMKSSIVGAVIVAAERGYTFEELIAIKNRLLFSHPQWKKFPRWAEVEATSYWYGYEKSLARFHIWTHVLDGERVRATSPKCQGRARDIHQQGCELELEKKAASAFCYAYLIDNKVTFYPVVGSEREKEVASGRISTMKVPNDATLLYVMPNGKLGMLTEIAA